MHPLRALVNVGVILHEENLVKFLMLKKSLSISFKVIIDPRELCLYIALYKF